MQKYKEKCLSKKLKRIHKYYQNIINTINKKIMQGIET